MKQHLYRTLLIYGVIVVALIQIYPTIGWVTLSDEERVARLERWDEEDDEFRAQEPSVIRNFGHAVKRWSEFDRNQVIDLGLDLQGGIHMVVGFDLTDEQIERGYDQSGIQEMVLQRIRRRVAEFEAKEPLIASLGDNQVQIQLPGEKDIERAERLIMKTAYLTFHPVEMADTTTEIYRQIDQAFDNSFVPYLERTFDPGMYEVLPEHVDHVRDVIRRAEEQGVIPEAQTLMLSSPPNPWETDKNYTLYTLEREPAMDGENLAKAQASPDQQNPPYWMIGFEFNGEGATDFARVTEDLIGRNLAIVLDNVVVSAPRIEERIYGSGRISGSFSQQQAVDLEIALNSGSLPVPIREDYKGIVGPTLGHDSVVKGIISAIVGIAVVSVFMIIYYRVGGVIVNIALVLNAILILAALSYFGATLTLPGIAGLILTIGMAVDANVLIFERIREELKNGKSLLASVDGGYSRATITILDANVTTLIAAMVLMEFGTGPIEGFAVALSVGVCASVFTSLVVTRALLDFMTNRGMLKDFSMMSIVKPGLKINFLEKRRVAGLASAAVIVVGLVFFGMRGADNFGVDFTTGTNMTVTLQTDENVAVADVRRQLETQGFTSPVVQLYEDAADATANQFVIRVGEISGFTSETGAENIAANSVSHRVQEALAPLCGPTATPDNVVLEKLFTVGPAVGRQLQRDALQAIAYSLVFIVAYLWFRFELKFALGAVAALVHDVFVTVGIFAVFGREITMPVIAAILTIIGYSLNDTIVVFDRVREDLRLYRGRDYSFLDVLNMSINQTLSRTLLTSLTTLFVVVILFFFGGAGINDFALALIVGVVVGTYSSIFIASPVVHLWDQYRGRHAAPPAPRRKTAETEDDDGEGGEKAASDLSTSPPPTRPTKKRGGKKKSRAKRKTRGATA